MRILLVIILLSTFNLQAQEEMKVKREDNGVKVTYEFNDLKGKRAEEGPKELCIVLTNSNDYDVKVSFSLAFFEAGLVNEESAVMKLCIPAGKSVKGKKNGLCWLITEENDAKMKEDSFDWDLNDFSVEKTDSCK